MTLLVLCKGRERVRKLGTDPADLPWLSSTSLLSLPSAVPPQSSHADEHAEYVLINWRLLEGERFCVVLGCVSALWLLSDSTPTFYLKFCVTQPPLRQFSSPPLKQTHSCKQTLHPYLSLNTLHHLLLAAPHWKENKSCVWSGTLSALICLWNWPTVPERGLVFTSLRGSTHSYADWASRSEPPMVSRHFVSHTD